MWFYFFLSALAALVLFVCLMPVHIAVNIRKYKDDDEISIYTKTGYGLINIKAEISLLRMYFKAGRPVVEYKAQIVSPRTRKLIASFYKLFPSAKMHGAEYKYKNNRRGILGIVNYLWKKVKIRKFHMKLGIGTGDAAETGIIYGFVWIAISNILAFSNSHFTVGKPVAIVIPYFDTVCFGLDFNCIISWKVGHIINAGIRAKFALLSGKRI